MKDLIHRISNSKYLNLYIIISFLLAAFMTCSVLLMSGVVVGSPDLLFHIQRISGLIQAFHHQLFPQFNLYSMNQNGSAVFILYPYATLLPVILFFSIFKITIVSFYICVILMWFIGFLISYYACKNYTNSVKDSYLFAFLYGTSSTIVNALFGSGDVGAFIAILVLPLSIFGFMKFLKDGSWKQLSLGMLLLIFTHILSTIIVTVFLLIWALINYKKIIYDKTKYMNLAKAVLWTFLLSAVFTLPMLNMLMTNVINRPYSFTMNGNDIFSTLLSPFNNSNTSVVLGFAGLVGLLIALFFMFKKRLAKIDRQALILSLVTLTFATNFIIPWSQINLNSLKLLQFPYRLDMIPQLLLVYLVSVIVTEGVNYDSLLKFKFIHGLFNDGNTLKYFVIGCLTIASLFFQMFAQSNYVTVGKSYNPLNENYIDRNINYGKHFTNDQNQNAYKIVSNHQFYHLINSPYSVPQTPDYYPSDSFVFSKDLSERNGIYNVDKKIKFKLLGNGRYEFDNKSKKMIQELNLPIVEYYGFDYSVYMDGKLTPEHRNISGLVTINNVPHGRHYLNIQIQKNDTFKLGFLLTLFSLAYLIFSFINNALKDKKWSLRRKQ